VASMTHTPPIHSVFRDVLADLPELTFSGEGTRFQQCFGCGPTHEIGLRVRCFRAAGEVLSPIVVPRRYEGPPGAVHGGIVAAYLDEVLAGAAVHHTGRPYVTGELSVRYVKPTPVERPLLGRGRATRATPRYIDVEATLEDLETREIVARAKGRFFPMPAPNPSGADATTPPG
jgi:acyl-coenzyme A thioesterase PaaI-like protein